MECQSKVANDTITMTATSAAMGMSETTGPKTMHSTIRNAPARNVDRRVRAPETFTLIIVWPIMAQPPMPPKNPVTMLAMPWPMDSRVLEEWVSVISSTSLAVISDSISPTSAIAKRVGGDRGQGVQGERHVRQAGHGQRGRQIALVAHGRHGDPRRRR